jgi:hypothetical protein
VSTSTYGVGKRIKVASILLATTMAITPNGNTLYVLCAGGRVTRRSSRTGVAVTDLWRP